MLQVKKQVVVMKQRKSLICVYKQCKIQKKPHEIEFNTNKLHM